MSTVEVDEVVTVLTLSIRISSMPLNSKCFVSCMLLIHGIIKAHKFVVAGFLDLAKVLANCVDHTMLNT